jgi:hypothetical protein
MAGKKVETSKDDFDALDRLARSITPDEFRAPTPRQRGQ